MITKTLLSTSEVIDIIREYIPAGYIWINTDRAGVTVSIECDINGKIYRYNKLLTRVEIVHSTKAYQEAWTRTFAQEAAAAFEQIGEQQ